jgi:hypothetical protein
MKDSLQSLIEEVTKEFWDKYNSYYRELPGRRGLHFAHGTARGHLRDFIKEKLTIAYNQGKNENT